MDFVSRLIIIDAAFRRKRDSRIERFGASQYKDQTHGISRVVDTQLRFAETPDYSDPADEIQNKETRISMVFIN